MSVGVEGVEWSITDNFSRPFPGQSLHLPYHTFTLLHQLHPGILRWTHISQTRFCKPFLCYTIAPWGSQTAACPELVLCFCLFWISLALRKCWFKVFAARLIPKMRYWPFRLTTYFPADLICLISVLPDRHFFTNWASFNAFCNLCMLGLLVLNMCNPSIMVYQGINSK